MKPHAPKGHLPVCHVVQEGAAVGVGVEGVADRVPYGARLVLLGRHLPSSCCLSELKVRVRASTKSQPGSSDNNHPTAPEQWQRCGKLHDSAGMMPPKLTHMLGVH